jgi:hypothetical protein
MVRRHARGSEVANISTTLGIFGIWDFGHRVILCLAPPIL